MTDLEDKAIRDALDEVFWQIEEAKRLNLPIIKAMNFINLSKDAQLYGNKKLASGLIGKAKDALFGDMVDHIISMKTNNEDVVNKMRFERSVKEARDRYSKGDLKGAYDILLQGDRREVAIKMRSGTAETVPQQYSESLDALQKVWLKMKQEEGKGKDMTKAKALVGEAKAALAVGNYSRVMELSQEVMGAILSPHDRLKEEVEETIVDITRTLKALFPGEVRSPKERFFKKQIEDLLLQAKDRQQKDRPVEAINYSRKAREILGRLEQETIKTDIPKMVIELRASLNELKLSGVDISYEEYLIKQVEETFWKGEYIKARKMANKLESITKNAAVHLKMSQLSERLKYLSNVIDESPGKDKKGEAKDLLEKAKTMLDQAAFDTASKFLDRASEMLNV